MFVHVRNGYYMQHGIHVTVLNFAAEKDYELDGIRVITPDIYAREKNDYDILVVHSANVRLHYRFLKKYGGRFPRFVFFFHGHEVLKMSEAYPKPFDYTGRSNPLRVRAQDAYDDFKFSVWRKYYPRVAKKSDFVFVSQSLFNEFRHYVRLDERDLAGHVHIIHNSVGQAFEQGRYPYDGPRDYDFITIRSNMDDSTYCIDLVERYARKYPHYRFLVIGRGRYFDVHSVPPNMTWVNRFLRHREMFEYIDRSRCGLMPTRQDTQGVMSCEFAVYGLPLITSDIAVCREIFGDLDDVALISNDVSQVDLPSVFDRLLAGEPYEKSQKFSYANTVAKEEAILLAPEAGASV